LAPIQKMALRAGAEGGTARKMAIVSSEIIDPSICLPDAKSWRAPTGRSRLFPNSTTESDFRGAAAGREMAFGHENDHHRLSRGITRAAGGAPPAR
jgi:hypothetical protein